MAAEEGVAELEVQRGENRVRIRRYISAESEVAFAPPQPISAPPLSPAVEPGQVLCIIESMKLMNEIEAEIAGILESKLVQNGQPVEYGEALFAIRPV